MCTAIIRWPPHGPLCLLALRDEYTGRAFDDPGKWWPDQPGVIGGRDRQAGGSWCVSDVASGCTALVLNRPQRPVAEPGAPSRGVLPLLAVQHGEDWPTRVQLVGMASFAVVLVSARALILWEFDGTGLTRSALGHGTHMVTSRGPEDRKSDRHLGTFASGDCDTWRDVVTASPVQDDPSSLLVRHERDGRVFATVFGQLIRADVGRLSVSYSRSPWDPATWIEQSWAAD